MTLLLSLSLLVQAGGTDSLRVRLIERPPQPGEVVRRERYGPPQVQIRTGQGNALVWLLQAKDTFFVAAAVPDSTPYWGDDFVVSVNTGGQPTDRPGHDDFQWYFRRTPDSTVIYRGRAGRWEAPRGDPDWRLGPERSGGGWEVETSDDGKGWSLVLRLDPAWLRRGERGPPRIAFRIYDDSPQGWFAWPAPANLMPVSVERTPSLWAHINLPASP